MRLPSDWETDGGGGFFPHLAHLVHIPCGFRTGMPYDLWGSDPNFGESSARRVVGFHQCDPDDCST